jgi:hypothetical protein
MDATKAALRAQMFRGYPLTDVDIQVTDPYLNRMLIGSGLSLSLPAIPIFLVHRSASVGRVRMLKYTLAIFSGLASELIVMLSCGSGIISALSVTESPLGDATRTLLTKAAYERHLREGGDPQAFAPPEFGAPPTDRVTQQEKN